MAGNDHPDYSKPVMVAGTARAAVPPLANA